MKSRDVHLTLAEGRCIWMRAQGLDSPAPFGVGPDATLAAIRRLGYVQIDTIHVIERCHHHILATRISSYRRGDLQHAQSVAKTVFEYWTHALAYLPTEDYRYFATTMRRHRRDPSGWFEGVDPKDARRVVRLIRRDGPLSIRDIDDDHLMEKHHAWGSRKPSKRALQLGFFNGILTVSARHGMLKTYDLADRHFGWTRAPNGASEREYVAYLVKRALRAQGIVSVESVCHLERAYKPAVLRLLEGMARRGELLRVTMGEDTISHWVPPEVCETPASVPTMVHLLSPFDPIAIQRDRFERFFGYRHLFEAYVPKAKRTRGYFALPVLVGDRVAAAIDCKTDRVAGTLLIQQWTWIGKRVAGDKARIDEALHRFEQFQLAD